MSRRALISSLAWLALGVLHASLARALPPQFISSWGTFGGGNGQFQYPMGLVLDGAGGLYVADWFNCRVQKFTASGAYLSQWGTYGSGPGQFSGPIGVALDQSGNIYVTDASSRMPLVNNRVEVFTSGGAYLREWGPPGTWGEPSGSAPGRFDGPGGIAVDANGVVFVADTFNHRIQVFNSNGVYVTEWNTATTGGLSYPRGVALDASGNLYVADDGANCIHVFSSAGARLDRWGSIGSGVGQMMYPYGVAVDHGNVYVTDAGNHRIEVFTGSGTYLTGWGTLGNAPGQFNNPMGIAVDQAGFVYVADQGNHRIQLFGPALTPTRSTSWGRLKALYR